MSSSTESVPRIQFHEMDSERIELPKEYQGKKVLSKRTDEIIVSDLPIPKGTVEVLLKRISLKFDGVDALYRRPMQITDDDSEYSNVKKEFAKFLKVIEQHL